jgi:hypothetical protein
MSIKLVATDMKSGLGCHSEKSRRLNIEFDPTPVYKYTCKKYSKGNRQLIGHNSICESLKFVEQFLKFSTLFLVPKVHVFPA